MLMPNVIAATNYQLQRVQIQTTQVENVNPSGFGPASVGFKLTATGDEQTRKGLSAPYVTVGPFVLQGVPTDYEVRYDGTGATLGGDPLNTWLDFSTDREWTLLANQALEVFNGTIELRRASDGYLLLSQSLQLRADNR